MKAAFRAFDPRHSGAAPQSRLKKNLLLLARIAVTVLLLYVALRHVDWRTLVLSLHHIDPALLFAGFLALLLQALLGALRWRLIVQGCGIALNIATAIRYSLIAAFFNQTLPASVGGDAARIWLLGRVSTNWKAAVYSIAIDRSVGGIALAVLVLACLPLAFQLIPDDVGRLGLLFAGGGCLFVFTAVLAIGALPWSQIDHWSLTRHARDVTAICRKLFLFSPPGAAIAVLSIAIHALSALAVWFIAHALAVPLAFSAALVLVPPIMLIAMIPVSIAGWGVREGAMVAILAYAHVGSSAGFLISVLFGAAAVAVGLIGGALLALHRGPAPAGADAAP